MKTTPYEDGDPRSPIVFLGQAPAAVEMKLGRPLVGPSGDVFADCLHSAGLARRQVYIVNMWPFRVQTSPRSDLVLDDRQGDVLYHKKRFTEAGLEAAQPALEKLRKCKANIIVPMGTEATQLCAGRWLPITKWRGSVIAGGDAIDGRKMIPTIHPAATLWGTYTWRYLLMHDYGRAKEEAESPRLTEPVYKIEVAKTIKEVGDFIDYCSAKGRVATDLEVINHQVSCFSLACETHYAMVVPLHHQGGDPYWTLEEEIALWEMYARLMEDPDVAKINQNLMGFDGPFLADRNNILLQGPICDTMVAQHIIYPDFPKGLDFITSIHTKMPYYKDEGKMWRGTGGDIEQFWVYNGRDAISALVAWEALVKELDDGYWPSYNMTIEMYEPLLFMHLRGLKVDRDRLAETNKAVGDRIDATLAKLNEVADYEFNPASPKQVKEYFYEHKGLAEYRNANGGVTTDDKALARIYRKSRLQEAKLIQEYRALSKLKATYLEVSFDADQRLRCSWNPRGTNTGRLSSSKTVFNTGLNLQNLHPGFKGFIVADGESNAN